MPDAACTHKHDPPSRVQRCQQVRICVPTPWCAAAQAQLNASGAVPRLDNASVTRCDCMLVFSQFTMLAACRARCSGPAISQVPPAPLASPRWRPTQATHRGQRALRSGWPTRPAQDRVLTPLAHAVYRYHHCAGWTPPNPRAYEADTLIGPSPRALSLGTGATSSGTWPLEPDPLPQSWHVASRRTQHAPVCLVCAERCLLYGKALSSELMLRAVRAHSSLALPAGVG